MKNGTARLQNSTMPVNDYLSNLNTTCWPFKILTGKHGGRLAFIYIHKARKYVRFMDTLTGDTVSSLTRHEPTTRIRMLDAGEVIITTVGEA